MELSSSITDAFENSRSGDTPQNWKKGIESHLGVCKLSLFHFLFIKLRAMRFWQCPGRTRILPPAKMFPVFLAISLLSGNNQELTLAFIKCASNSPERGFLSVSSGLMRRVTLSGANAQNSFSEESSAALCIMCHLGQFSHCTATCFDVHKLMTAAKNEGPRGVRQIVTLRTISLERLSNLWLLKSVCSTSAMSQTKIPRVIKPGAQFLSFSCQNTD